jgi:hypothetical protein
MDADREPRLSMSSSFGENYRYLKDKITVADQPLSNYSSRMDLSLEALEKAVSIRRKIDVLQRRLSSLFGTYASSSSTRKGRRRMSAATRAKLAAAAKARWAKRKGGRTRTATKPQQKKGGLTPAGRRRLSQLMKARWEAKKRATRQK